MISIYQGNDKNFLFFRKDVNEKIITTRPISMWFTVKTNAKAESYLFQKNLINGISQNENGSWNISVSASDTENIKPGRYFCDVKIQDESGRLLTIVKPQDFIIREVATKVSNQGG